MSRRVYHDGDTERVEHALADLRSALRHLKLAGARKTADRVRLAISSAKGAVRNTWQLRQSPRSRCPHGYWHSTHDCPVCHIS